SPQRGGESPAQKERGTARSLLTILVVHALPVVQRLRLMRPDHLRGPGIHWRSHVHQAAFRVHTPIDQQRRATVQHVLRIDLLLQQYQPLKHRLWTRRAAADIDVDRDDAVDALHGRIVAIEPPRGSTGPEGHNPFRLAHLVVYALEHRGNFMINGAYHHQQVGLTWGKAWELRPKTRHIVMRAPGSHKFHAATGRHKGEGKEGILPSPVDDFVQLCRDHSRPKDRFQTHLDSFLVRAGIAV